MAFGAKYKHYLNVGRNPRLRRNPCGICFEATNVCISSIQASLLSCSYWLMMHRYSDVFSYKVKIIFKLILNKNPGFQTSSMMHAQFLASCLKNAGGKTATLAFSLLTWKSAIVSYNLGSSGATHNHAPLSSCTTALSITKVLAARC